MVRDILDLESVPAQSTSDISHNNYDFVFLQQEKLGDVPTYLLRMIPKRKEKDLLNGLVWVDTRTFRIQRIEGTPTKKPSWWIKSLYITLQYTDLHGLWLPTYMRAGASGPCGWELPLDWRRRRIAAFFRRRYERFAEISNETLRRVPGRG